MSPANQLSKPSTASPPKAGFLAFGHPGHRRAADREAFSPPGLGPSLPLYGQKMNGRANDSAPRPHLFLGPAKYQGARQWPRSRCSLPRSPSARSEARVRQRSLPSKAVPSTSGSRPRSRAIPFPSRPSSATRFSVKREDDARLPLSLPLLAVCIILILHIADSRGLCAPCRLRTLLL